MARLIVNAWVNGQGWGPDYGNAADVPSEVAAEIDDPDAWDQSPDVPSLATEIAEHLEALTVAQIVVTDDFRAQVDALVAAGDEHGVHKLIGAEVQRQTDERSQTPGPDAAPPSSEPDQTPPVKLSPTEQLASIASDKAALLAFAADLGIEVDGRLGAAKLHAVIEGALSGG